MVATRRRRWVGVVGAGDGEVRLLGGGWPAAGEGGDEAAEVGPQSWEARGAVGLGDGIVGTGTSNSSTHRKTEERRRRGGGGEAAVVGMAGERELKSAARMPFGSGAWVVKVMECGDSGRRTGEMERGDGLSWERQQAAFHSAGPIQQERAPSRGV